MVYTNGDYLDEGYLARLAEVGLDYMHVSIHTRFNGTYSEVDALDLIARLVRRLKTPIRYKQLKSGQYIVAQIPHPRIEIEVRAINYQQHGTDRAGLVSLQRKVQTRTAPCHFPFAHFHVGFSGNVVPCCHVRSDASEHAPYVYGNLDDYGSIFQAWASRHGAAWRQELITDLPKRTPCGGCSVGFLDGGEKAQQQARAIWLRHVQSGVMSAPQGTQTPQLVP